MEQNKDILELKTINAIMLKALLAIELAFITNSERETFSFTKTEIDALKLLVTAIGISK